MKEKKSGGCAGSAFSVLLIPVVPIVMKGEGDPIYDDGIPSI